MKLPLPTDLLAECVWLPRILAKARSYKSGVLAEEYATRFCHPSGVDGHFLSYFEISRDELMEVASMDDSEVCSWFVARCDGRAFSIEGWNEQATNMGRPGFPLGERFPVAMATVYQHVASFDPQTVFEALLADERDLET